MSVSLNRPVLKDTTNHPHQVTNKSNVCNTENIASPRSDSEQSSFKAKSHQASEAMQSALKTSQMTSQLLKDLINANPFFLEAKAVNKTAALLNCKPVDLLKPLIELTKPFARPEISKYYVSVLGLGKSGNIYLGVNLEFEKNPLNQTVHGEQFLIVNAKNHGETELVAIALSAAPCGHCRQFLNEIIEDNQMQILTPENPDTDLPHLLPKAFGPKNLDRVNGLLTTCPEFEKSKHECPLTARAIDAAHSSYAPYTEAISGVAIKTKKGEFYSGSYSENAAYNPSISPLQAALVAFVAAQQKYNDIEEVVLAEKKNAIISQEDTTIMILKRIAPNAKFKSYDLELKH